jgi:hypothetical protein
MLAAARHPGWSPPEPPATTRKVRIPDEADLERRSLGVMDAEELPDADLEIGATTSSRAVVASGSS